MEAVKELQEMLTDGGVTILGFEFNEIGVIAYLNKNNEVDEYGNSSRTCAMLLAEYTEVGKDLLNIAEEQEGVDGDECFILKLNQKQKNCWDYRRVNQVKEEF